MSLDAMLCELAEAEDDCRTHLDRFPTVNHHAYNYREPATIYQRAADPEACAEDWKRCYRRREMAIAALLEYARGVRRERAA